MVLGSFVFLLPQVTLIFYEPQPLTVILVRWLVGWLVGWLAGWLVCCRLGGRAPSIPGCLVAGHDLVLLVQLVRGWLDQR